jgi:23S rRNA (adenine2503-C2)-methyltransferase
MGLQRNLNAGEIIEQYLHLSRLYGPISNIVYMGMGEPFHNTEAVIKSLRLFTDPNGWAISPRRITVSTCGLVDGIYKMTEEAPAVRLALSLVTADENSRNALIPVSRNNSLKMIREALLHYQRIAGRRITLECVIIRDVNDKAADAALIADWACGLKVNVNVIPWNPAAEINFREPEKSSVEAFCRELERRGISVSRRYRRGRGLNAACGQLAAGSDN